MLANTSRNIMAVVHLHAVCLAKVPQPLPKQVPRTVRSSASFFVFQYPLISLMPFSSCLRHLPRLPDKHDMH